jgi:hypothetical protein
VSCRQIKWTVSLPIETFGEIKSLRDLFEFCKQAAAAGLVNRLFRAAVISLPAEFAVGRERSSTLFARAWFGLSDFLSFAGEAGLGHAHASATGAFRTTLAAVAFSFVCISFAGPLIFDHCATGARR